MDLKLDFQRKLVQYLESCHIGEYMTGTQSEVLEKVNGYALDPQYKDPTQTLPEEPPAECSNVHHENPGKIGSKSCEKCDGCKAWHTIFQKTVDDLLSRSNIHNCERNQKKDGSQNKRQTYIGCKNNEWGKCKARFPCELHEETMVALETGASIMKKAEPWLNTVTPALTYIMRCNTDVTSLSSGTAIKAVIMYVTDYITKPGLKTHVVFEAIKAIFS